jgi:hypothetical protein
MVSPLHFTVLALHLSLQGAFLESLAIVVQSRIVDEELHVLSVGILAGRADIYAVRPRLPAMSLEIGGAYRAGDGHDCTPEVLFASPFLAIFSNHL